MKKIGVVIEALIIVLALLSLLAFFTHNVPDAIYLMLTSVWLMMVCKRAC